MEAPAGEWAERERPASLRIVSRSAPLLGAVVVGVSWGGNARIGWRGGGSWDCVFWLLSQSPAARPESSVACQPLCSLDVLSASLCQ